MRAPYSLKAFTPSVKFYYNGWRKDGVGYVDPKYIRRGNDAVSKHKLFVPRVWGAGDLQTDHVHPFYVEPNSCSTETYLTIGPFATKVEAENALSYTQTKFFHFMVALIKNTQQAMQRVYLYVPMQDFSKSWTDGELYEKYALTNEEISFIESMVNSGE